MTEGFGNHGMYAGLPALAIEFAARWHGDQKDKQGEPYLKHLLRVGLSFNDPLLQTIGFLHDVVEDTACTIRDVRMKFGRLIADVVDALTHRPGESREDYMNRIRREYTGNAARVKLADFKDNLRPGADPKYVNKYARDLGVLLA